MGVALKLLVAFLLAACCPHGVQGGFFRLRWSGVSEEMKQPLIEQKKEEAKIPVTEILRSQDCSFTSEEKQNVLQKVALMAQLENSGVRMESNAWEAVRFEANKQKLMQEDQKALRDDLKIFLESSHHSRWLEGRLKNSRDNHFFTIVVILHDLQSNIEEAELSDIKEGEIINRNSQTALQGEVFEAMKQKYKQKLESLLRLTVDMRPHMQIKTPDIKFLYLQRSIFKTMYYLYKYKITDTQDFGPLLENYDTIKDFARYIFYSYKFYQQGSSKIIYLSSKNVLELWHYFPFMDMLKGLGTEYMENFSAQYTKIVLWYYKNLSKYPKNHRIETKLKDFGIIPLSEKERLNFEIMDHIVPSTNYNLNLNGGALAELIDIFTNVHVFDKHGKYHTELAILFQLIQNQKEYYPLQYERLQERPNGFEEKFDLMSSSFKFLEELENIHIHLKKKFTTFEYNFLPSYPSENVEISKKNIKDLQILAKYLKITVSENLGKNKPMNPENPLYRYSHCGIIKDKIDDLKSRIIDLTEYYESYVSQSSVMSFLCGWIPSRSR
ncbi:hypothetical protein PGT21_014608 [Puccinia graminis f. sp. tritici]|uniref:Uncharacterized protein n=1 Tax=Puccinia graminis f. sp. tritici TaxID=56615 RepID=A0A5B0QFZ6_PUCGR|nr:hypothetical protein PGT21_014608 [Puccinia graminis f. sp. tritici]